MKVANEYNPHANEIKYDLPQEMTDALPAKHGTILFTAYGCVLTERQTSAGVYVYTAVNISTGMSVILSRRNNQLAGSIAAHTSMAQKIYVSPIRGDAVYTTEKKPGEAAVKDSKLTATANHIFSDILPRHGYAVRGNQIELTEHILEVIGKRGITLAESEVGTGKTHSYLIAALLAKRGRLNDTWLRGHYPKQSWAESAHMPVVISTSSIALQKAIVTDYIPELSQILIQHGVIRTPLTAVIRKGKEHFICEKRLLAYRNSITNSIAGTDARTKALLEPFIGRCAPYDLTGADSLTSYMKRRICVMERCSDGCKHSAVCRYQAYLKEANDPKVDFQITNHNYFIADTLHRASGKRPLLPNYQLVIVDEAHKFLQAARQMYGLELTDAELSSLAQEIHAITLGKSNSGINVHRLAKKMTEQNGKLFNRLNDSIPKDDSDDDAERFPAVVEGDVSRHLKSIAGITADLANVFADSRVPKPYEERKSKVLWRLGVYGERVSELRKHSRLIHWFEKRTEGEKITDVLCAIPKDLDERLYHDLWSKGIPVVLTSGTLSAGNHNHNHTHEHSITTADFTRAKQTLGLDHLPERTLFDTTMPSPFDYKRNTLLYISESVPFPDNKDKRYIAAVADEIERLVTASHGHVAVLFTSYNAMGQVHAILKNRNLSFPLFRLERGGVHAIERFKRSNNGILLASGALWEGIDIPGDTLSMLSIVKLPFAVPDPIGDYERELCGDMETYKARAIVPDMLVKLKQGHGRLIRSETDTGVVAILDSRANERGAYRQRVLAALPECKTTSDIEAVRDFFVDKKPAAYFID
ncbi:MAG: ATP-dependent DNA helicase [Defluviitaleaceae bacterium]|nr:ATP-dependent DNA helicase [Defluviitaleaceae bacterium]